jgi:hypothetical protein
MNHWTNLDWDFDNCQTSLNAAKLAYRQDDTKETIKNLEYVIFTAQEAIERLKKGEK